MKITKKQFDKLYSDNITKKEYDRIIELVDERFGEVVLLIHPNITKGKGWFSYGNLDYDSESDEGFFDIDEYKEEIQIGGEYWDLPEPYEEGCIPTRWLWTEDGEIMKEYNKEVNKIRAEEVIQKAKQKLSRELKKKKKIEIKNAIISKLTKEELKYIVFK